MATLYRIWDGSDEHFFETKAAALKEARVWAAAVPRSSGRTVDVERYIVAEGLPKRELYCRFLNGHWASEIEKVASFPGTSREDEE